MKMGWFFNRSETTAPAQTFGSSNNSMGGLGAMGGYGMNGMMGGGMDPMQMQMMQQNPMMQQMANDPVMATSRLLQYYDPVSAFIVSANFAGSMNLIGEVMTMALKDFFANVKLTTDEDGKISLDLATLPTNIATMSAENLALSLQGLQASAQQQLQMNNQQTQMLLQAHNPMATNQPGFFGSMIGTLLGNQIQQQGGMGGMGAMGAAALV
tara:strand:+ start:315 stop:947 length:633 start_codon:yes stop_codon:yes gene_type:complete